MQIETKGIDARGAELLSYVVINLQCNLYPLLAHMEVEQVIPTNYT